MDVNLADHTFNNFVIIYHLCNFTNREAQLALRSINRICNEGCLLYMSRDGRRPQINLVTDNKIKEFFQLMRTRNPDSSPFSSFSLSLGSTSLPQVQEFARNWPHRIREFKFVDVHSTTTWELTPHQDNDHEIQNQQIINSQFCEKISAILTTKGMGLEKINIHCKHDIPISQDLAGQLPSFPNLLEFKVHYLSNQIQMTGDLVSVVISKAPRLRMLEVSNFFGTGLLHYSPQLLRGLAQVLARPNPPLLDLRCHVFMDDLPAFETLVRNKFNHVRYFEFLHTFDPEIQDGWRQMEDFSKFLGFQSPTLEHLSIVAAGNTVLHPLRVPALANLKILEIAGAVDLHMNAIHPLLANQFPKLENLEICGHNLYRHLLGNTVFPSVKKLLLDLNYEDANISPRDEAATTDTIHVNFPNLKSLELRDKSYTNLKRVNYVLTHLTDLEVLILTTNMSLKAKTRNSYWKTFAGEEQRLFKNTILKLCKDGDPNEAIKENGVPSLVNMKNLQILEISFTLADQLGALAYVSRKGFMKPLEKLYIGFTHNNKISKEDKEDYLCMLSQYHKEVIVEELGPRQQAPL